MARFGDIGRTKVDAALCVLELNGRRKFLRLASQAQIVQSLTIWEWTGLSVLDKVCMNSNECGPLHALAS